MKIQFISNRAITEPCIGFGDQYAGILNNTSFKDASALNVDYVIHYLSPPISCINMEIPEENETWHYYDRNGTRQSDTEQAQDINGKGQSVLLAVIRG